MEAACGFAAGRRTVGVTISHSASRDRVRRITAWAETPPEQKLYVIRGRVGLPTHPRVGVSQTSQQQRPHTLRVQFPESTGQVAETEHGTAPHTGVGMLGEPLAEILGPNQILVMERHRQDDPHQYFRLIGIHGLLSRLTGRRLDRLVPHDHPPSPNAIAHPPRF
jgi:hypothetical protein